MYKVPPYYPRLDTFDPELSLSKEDIEFLVENGFNVVRLYIAWPGVEPSKNQYNDTYLEVRERYHPIVGMADVGRNFELPNFDFRYLLA